jgi:hypothetical protein
VCWFYERDVVEWSPVHIPVPGAINLLRCLTGLENLADATDCPEHDSKRLLIMFKRFFERRRKAEFDRGFEWAAGRLLKGTPSELIEFDIELAFETAHFDRGMQEAVRRWRKLFCSDTGR